jgi:hypothetical protein
VPDHGVIQLEEGPFDGFDFGDGTIPGGIQLIDHPRANTGHEALRDPDDVLRQPAECAVDDLRSKLERLGPVA